MTTKDPVMELFDEIQQKNDERMNYMNYQFDVMMDMLNKVVELINPQETDTREVNDLKGRILDHLRTSIKQLTTKH